VVALRVVDAVLAQQLQRVLVLDALGDGLLAESAGEVDDRLDEVLVGGVEGQVADELDVDLEDPDRQARCSPGPRPSGAARAR
jgi:hypothetical protein